MSGRFLGWAEKLQRLPIGRRVLFSAIAGIFISCTFIYPIDHALFHYLNFGNDQILAPERLFQAMLRAPALAVWGCIIMSPLIVIAMAVSIAFQKSIEKNLVLWCFLSTILVPVFAGTFLMLNDSEDRNLFETLMRSDLFIWGPIPSAVIFYLISPKNKKKVI